MLLDLVWFILGGALLYLGAEWLVRGAVGLARAFGVRPLAIGLTVVAYGTSAPELTVGIEASLGGHGSIALGNAIGSNVANLGLILGITTMIAPPRVEGSLMRRELFVLLATSALLPFVLLDGTISRLEGAAMVAAVFVFTLGMLRAPPGVAAAVAEEAEVDAERAGAPRGLYTKARLAFVAIVGLVLLLGGGELFVESASKLARDVGLSERVVGLTMVAVGTSLPELAASVVAALRGHASIAIGNIIGSNIFNVLLILGASALARPIHAPLRSVGFDLGALGAITVLGVALMRSDRMLSRVEGVMLLMAYIGFLLALFVVR